jgi:hypothetical protein
MCMPHASLSARLPVLPLQSPGHQQDEDEEPAASRQKHLPQQLSGCDRPAAGEVLELRRHPPGLGRSGGRRAENCSCPHPRLATAGGASYVAQPSTACALGWQSGAQRCNSISVVAAAERQQTCGWLAAPQGIGRQCAAWASAQCRESQHDAVALVLGRPRQARCH